ncbi:MAG: nucleoside phosphorylase [Conexivisphaerales archaeon]
MSEKKEISEGRLQYHLKMKNGDVADYVLLPGDRARVDLMSTYLKDVKLSGSNREYLAKTGYFNSIKVTVMSTGMGCPAAAIAIEELANIGAKVFIRTGSTGALQPEIDLGDLVIPNGAVKNEGTTRMYEPAIIPAVPSTDVLMALIQAAEDMKDTLGFKYHVGITSSDDAFYAEDQRFIKKLTTLGILSLDMESSAIFTVARLRRLKAGSIMAASENFSRKIMIPEQVPEQLKEGWKKETQVALRAIEILEKSGGRIRQLDKPS